jgi:hypothetical protein
MSRSYKFCPFGIFRSPRGHKQALIQEVRSGAVPPNNWDDIPHDKMAFFPYELVERFVKEGKSTEWIVRKIHHRVGGFKRAEEMVRRTLKRKAIIGYRMM